MRPNPKPPSRVVVFGDSYTDRGNMLELTGDWPPSPPYADGRFCNGPLWYEVAGTELGWPEARASLRGGDVYAYGGAHTDSATGTTLLPCFGSAPIPTIGRQIDTFLASAAPSPSDLFIIGSNNDLNYELLGLGGNPPATAVANMVDHVETLADAGASFIVVQNMVPLSKLPFAPDPNRAAMLTDTYNSLLETAMFDAAVATGVDIRVLDAHGVLTDIVNDPGSFGITNTTSPALTGGAPVCTVIVGGSPVTDPDEHFLWDLAHTTRIPHRVLGEALVAVLTCPPDFTQDRVLDIFDFVAFQDAFIARHPRADMDADGQFTIFDFVAFQDAFVAGCE